MKRPSMRSSAIATVLLSASVLALTVKAQPQVPAPADVRTASPWSQLWRTADQRGQALLQRGDAAAAAKEFADPQHKAHAALLAGDYASAAQTLDGIDNAEAHYNRGNALAHAGDLQAAIKAYDAALKHNPQHTDARHNRDLVAAALQKQKPQDDKKDGDKKHDEKKDGGKSDSKPGDQKDNQSGTKPGEQQADKSAGKPGDKPDEKQSGKQNDKPGQTPSGKPGDKPDGQSTAKPGESTASAPRSDKSTAPATAASAAKDDAAQARRDAESALGKGARSPLAAQRGASGPNQAAIGTQPVTEKQIAQEQWLRAIPDDPSGLLRRKFLIEHMLRQQGQKP